MMGDKKIRVTQIDENQSIFRENKVVLFGAGSTGKIILELLKQFDIEVHSYCDNNEGLWGTLVNGIKVISPAELQELTRADKNILVQVTVGAIQSFIMSKSVGEVISQIKNLGIEKYIVAQETYHMLTLFKFLKFAVENHEAITDNDFLKDYKRKFDYIAGYDRFIRNMLNINAENNTILICLPPKTGDVTLGMTFIDNNVTHFNVEHQPTFFVNTFGKKVYGNMFGKIKIITAVREPIGQNISLLLQSISEWSLRMDTLVNAIRLNTGEYTAAGIQNVIDIIFKDGGNLQSLFDIQIKNNELIGRIQNFIPSFQENIIDIMKEPFDKEKGYSIIKEDNIEVFVYQLEKLNDIVPELSEWVGVPFDSLVIDNMGESKWNGASYKQAQKELKFSGEYFDKCYNEPYVKHFYSEQDIEKFKNRWRGNI